MMDAQAGIALWDGAVASQGGWSAIASTGSQARLCVEPATGGFALRFDFTLASETAFAIARLERAAELPPHYALRFALRGDAAANDLQLKLVDPSASVWWWRLPRYQIPPARSELVLRRAGLAFAWGPAGGGEPLRIAAVEVAVQAGHVGAGTLWIEALRIEPRGTTARGARAVRASSAQPGHEASRVLEQDLATSWRPTPADTAPWLELDLGSCCELGGLVVDWEDEATTCQLQGSDDGARWRPLAAGAAGGTRTWLRAEADARFLRLAPDAPGGTSVRNVWLVPIELAVAPIRHVESLARAAGRGAFPRHLLGETGAWGVVGGVASPRKGLLSEDGALEVDSEAWSLEPFLWSEGRLQSWADVERDAALAEGHLPLPSVTWRAPGLRLRIDAFHSGPSCAGVLIARYRVENESDETRRVRLFLTLRPFQVTPAWQGLNLTGGFAPLNQLERRGDSLRVDGRELVCVTRPDAFGTSQGGEDLIARHLAAGRTPTRQSLCDPLGLAEGALAYDLRLEPGACETLVVAVPRAPADAALPAGLARDVAAAWADARYDEAKAGWRERLAGIPIELPAAGADFADTLRACVAWILVNREGPRLQPGVRAYRRSWIRDGAGMAGALLEMGFAEEARAFLRWYAPHQQADGRVPCAVDRHGVDPVVEHDSHGELVWAIVEVFRHTRDRAFLAELWPHVVRAVDAIDALRSQRTTALHRGRASFGLLPESISHEGYSAQPVHAYWDDFFAVRALGDAADAAGLQGHEALAHCYAALDKAMRADLAASIGRTMALHGIDFVPGCVEHGDLDPTGTAIAFDPCGLEALLPSDALARTFARWWQEQDARRESTTPYEMRNAVAFLRLSEPERALELLTRWIGAQLPTAWRQWPEICWRDPRAPRFLGDLPHGWAAATFVRALRRLLVDERPDGCLALAAGVPEAWLAGDGVRVRALSTHYGPLSFTLRDAGAGRVQASFGAPIERPPGGIRLTSPLCRPLRSVLCDGRPHPDFAGRAVRLRDLPRELTLVS